MYIIPHDSIQNINVAILRHVCLVVTHIDIREEENLGSAVRLVPAACHIVVCIFIHLEVEEYEEGGLCFEVWPAERLYNAGLEQGEVQLQSVMSV